MRSFVKSEQLYNKSKLTLAGGVASSLRAAMKPVPLFIRNASGALLTDADGNEYVDYIMGYGPMILGHSHQEWTAALGERMLQGQQFGMQHEGEIELSERIVRLVPCADKVAFSGSGTEAVMLALRLARAATGRQKVIRFAGHYHGWSDAIYTSFPGAGIQSGTDSKAGTAGQSEAALEDIVLLPWNDEALLRQKLNEIGDQIAAVITEPVMCNSGCIRPLPGYLEAMRKLTEEKGIVLIFDEVITGFRVSPGGAQPILGVIPDLVTMGKAVAGGYPLSIVAGKKELMELIAAGPVAHLGTLNGNYLSMAAGIATLDILNRNEGAIYRHMNHISDMLCKGLQEILADNGIPHLINRFESVFHLMFTEERQVQSFDSFNLRNASAYARFCELALHEGVALRPNGLWYVSAGHTESDVQRTLDGLRSAAKAL